MVSAREGNKLFFLVILIKNHPVPIKSSSWTIPSSPVAFLPSFILCFHPWPFPHASRAGADVLRLSCGNWRRAQHHEPMPRNLRTYSCCLNQGTESNPFWVAQAFQGTPTTSVHTSQACVGRCHNPIYCSATLILKQSKHCFPINVHMHIAYIDKIGSVLKYAENGNLPVGFSFTQGDRIPSQKQAHHLKVVRLAMPSLPGARTPALGLLNHLPSRKRKKIHPMSMKWAHVTQIHSIPPKSTW